MTKTVHEIDGKTRKPKEKKKGAAVFCRAEAWRWFASRPPASSAARSLLTPQLSTIHLRQGKTAIGKVSSKPAAKLGE